MNPFVTRVLKEQAEPKKYLAKENVKKIFRLFTKHVAKSKEHFCPRYNFVTLFGKSFINIEVTDPKQAASAIPVRNLEK